MIYVLVKEEDFFEDLQKNSISKDVKNNGFFILKYKSVHDIPKELVRYTYYNKEKYKEALGLINSSQQVVEKKNYTVNIKKYPFESKIDERGNKLFKRVHGSDDYVDIEGGKTKTIEIEVAYPWAKIQGLELVGQGKYHSIDVLVIDDELGTYSNKPNQVINQFAFNVNISPEYYKRESSYDADLFMGMRVQIVVTNGSDTASKVAANLDFNEVRKA